VVAVSLLGWPLAAALVHSAGAALLVGVLASLLSRTASGVPRLLAS